MPAPLTRLRSRRERSSGGSDSSAIVGTVAKLAWIGQNDLGPARDVELEEHAGVGDAVGGAEVPDFRSIGRTR